MDETFKGLRKAFAMMALAMLASKPRSELNDDKLPPGVTIEPITNGVTSARLQTCIVDGDVTCIVPDPQPFVQLCYRGTFGEVKMVYGIWIGRQASWRGKIEPPKHILQPADDASMPTGENHA